MKIEVNGREHTAASGDTVADLLRALELDGRLVVVELNRQIVRRNELSEVALQEGDRVELVHFVGGG